MYVACSTLCFGKHPLERALRAISELEFSKIDLAIHERGPHLRPSEIAADVLAHVPRVRIGNSLSPVAFSVEIDAPTPEDHDKQFKAICRLARLSSVPVISIPAAPVGSGVAAEVARLAPLVHMATADNVILTVTTQIGTLTEVPAVAAELCQKVPGLGLTLDPSHYIAGPNQGKSFDNLYSYVRHVRLRDTGRTMEQFQLRVGQGGIEYGRIITQLARFRYERVLTVDIRDIPDNPFGMEPEVRKLKYLLESLV